MSRVKYEVKKGKDSLTLAMPMYADPYSDLSILVSSLNVPL